MMLYQGSNAGISYILDAVAAVVFSGVILLAVKIDKIVEKKE